MREHMPIKKKLYPVVINLLLPVSMKKMVNAEAKRREIPNAAFIREAIREKLERVTAESTK
jgi:hypothetical protein